MTNVEREGMQHGKGRGRGTGRGRTGVADGARVASDGIKAWLWRSRSALMEQQQPYPNQGFFFIFCEKLNWQQNIL